jgi:anti-anti-sigma factor
MSVQAFLGVSRQTATIQLNGDLDEDTVPLLRSLLERAMVGPVHRLVVEMDEVSSISAAGVRCLASVQQAIGPMVDITLVGVRPEVDRVLQLAGFDRAVRQMVG